MRIEKALEKYLKSNTRVTSTSTVNHYHVTLRQYQVVCGRSLRHLTDDNLAAFMRWVLSEGSSPATVNQKRDYICAFWRWCAKRGYVRRWPTVQAIPEPERVPEAWTLEQLEQLFAACRRQNGSICGIPAGDWWYSIHLWWYYTGERVCASLSVRWDHYDGSTILVPAECRKGGQKAMVYEMLPQMARTLEEISQPQRDLIWPWEQHIATFYNHYHRLLENADLPYRRWKSGPQKMRRSYASHLEAAGGNATLGLRHSRSSLTRKSYIDPRIAKGKNQSELLPRVG